jgi:DNA polymerase-3 subunit delta
MDSLAFLERAGRIKPGPLYVLHGDDAFLKREVLKALRERALGAENDDTAVSRQTGDKATFAGVWDELETVPFFHPRRLVVVEGADPFVTRFRAVLEKRIRELPATGMLILDVKTWPANTKLAKLVEDAATIVCKAPPAYKVAQWCVQWASAQHGKQLTSSAASMLADLVGPELGLLDQELMKLAIYVGQRGKIDNADVDCLVGQSRAEKMWTIFEAIGSGQMREALGILGRLFDQGEEPMRLLGAFSLQLRQLARAARLAQQGQSLNASLAAAGVPPFALRAAEQQVRHLGRARANQLYDWLLQVDLGLKGGSPLPPRTLLERLVVRLARKG